MRAVVGALGFFLFSSVGVGAEVVESASHIGGVSVVSWHLRGGKHLPLVLFSHGSGGTGSSARLLTRGIAAAGYWVVAPHHKDAIFHRRRGQRAPRQQPFDVPSRWTDATYRDRDEDLKRILAGLRAHCPPGLDLSRVGLVGHSLGGYTVLCAAGARPSWKLPGVRAVVALSPYLRPLHDRNQLAHLTVPVEFQSGTNDRPTVNFLRAPFGAFDQVRSPKLYVEVAGADHLSWSDYEPDPARHRLINRYVVAFLDRYVKGRAVAFSRALPGISDLRFSP